MWKDARWTVVDAETTGLDKRADRIIEVGVCVIENRQMLGTWSHVIDPQIMNLAPKVTEITGLKLADLIGRPVFAAVAPKLSELFEKSHCLAAYNARFDKPFFEREFQNSDWVMPNRPWLDPLVWVRNFDGSGKNKLVEACARHGIDASNAHRAEDDAQMAAELMLKMLDRLPDDLDSLISLQDIWQRRQDQAFRKKRPDRTFFR